VGIATIVLREGWMVGSSSGRRGCADVVGVCGNSLLVATILSEISKIITLECGWGGGTEV
jgi:hypothetical protein